MLVAQEKCTPQAYCPNLRENYPDNAQEPVRMIPRPVRREKGDGG